MHYTVAVITKVASDEEVENLLAPFDENIEVDPYIQKTKADIIKETRNLLEGVLKDQKEYQENREEYLKKYRAYWFEDEEKGTIKSYYQKLFECKDDEDFYKLYRGDGEYYDDDGNELSTYNPKSKWDWYSIGGRWDGYFNLKGGGRTNVAKISDIIWEGTEEEKESYRRYWEVVVEHQPLKEGEDKRDFFNLYKEEYYLNRYHTKEEYATRASAAHPYAVLTEEGEWVAPGEMGWFSSSESDEDQKKYEDWFFNYIKEHQDYYITLVDCHI